MLRIFLARHGQDRDNANGILNGHRDEPLTEVGIQQAQEVAAKIKEAGLKFDYILSSPLKRTQQTADIISEATHGPGPQVEPNLIERDFGSMTGVEVSRIEELCAPDIIKAEVITYFLRPPNAETFPSLLERSKKLLDEIKGNYKKGNILCVTHGDVGKMIYAAYYNLDWKDVLTLFHFGNSELLLLSDDSAPGEAHIFEVTQHNH